MIDTTNVIELTEDFRVCSIFSFLYDEDGRKEAKELFRRIIRENDSDITDKDLDMIESDGIWECGDYRVLLVHSF